MDGDRISVGELEQHIRGSDENILLLAMDRTTSPETAIGTILISPLREAPGHIRISMLCVDPQYQSQGVGRRLVQDALHLARDLGSSTCVIHVFDIHQDVIARFYKQKLGFVETGRMPFPLPALLKAPDVEFVVLEKSLASPFC